MARVRWWNTVEIKVFVARWVKSLLLLHNYYVNINILLKCTIGERYIIFEREESTYAISLDSVPIIINSLRFVEEEKKESRRIFSLVNSFALNLIFDSILILKTNYRYELNFHRFTPEKYDTGWQSNGWFCRHFN